MDTPIIDLWACFLFNEKLDPNKMDEDSIMELLYLCEELAQVRPPKVSMYKFKVESRRFVVDTALELGVDLLAMKDKRSGKRIIGRGLLDIWLIEYEKKFGSTKGTTAEFEAKRRDIKIKLCREGVRGVRKFNHQGDNRDSQQPQPG